MLCRSCSVVGLTALLIAGGVLAVAAAPSQQTPAKPAAPAATAPAATAPAAGQLMKCTIDPVHSKALFRVQHLGAGPFWGRFNDVQGSFQFTPGSADGMKFDVSIKIDSVDTGTEDLDKHLKSPDFFASKDFPTMTFVSTGAKSIGKNVYEVTGNLTMHGVTKPVTAALEFIGTADFGRGARAGFEAVFTVKRSEFGVNYGVEKDMIGNDVRVVVGLEGTVDKK